MTNKEKIRVEIENRIYNIENSAISTPQREGANLALKAMWVFINSLPEEPVSEDLEEAAIMHFKDVMEYEVKTGLKPAYMTSFKAGAQWQHEQMEKNRLAACDRQTDEEREREQQFVDEIVIGKQRIPTYSDAIEYGIRWQQQQGVAEEAEINYWNQRGLSIRIDKNLEDLGFEEGDKVKIIIVKE